MSIRELTPELGLIAKNELGEVTARIPEDLKAIKDWLAKQSYITARTDDQWLVAFLRGCKYSLERTKEKIDNFYTMKSTIPEMTMAVDPADKQFQDFVKLGSSFALRKPVSPGGPTVVVVRPGAYESSKFSVEHNVRVGNMISTILMLEDDNTIVAGQRYIIDLKNVDVGHFLQMTPTVIKKMVMSGEKAMPIRQKGSHHLYTPPGVETIFSLFKSIMNEKNKDRLYIHNENLEELYKFVPKEILPVEYGGDAGTIAEIAEYWAEKLLSYRDFFLEDQKYKTDEKKRPGAPKTAEGLFGTDGSFRQLNVD